MKRFRLKPVLCVLAALLLIVGLFVRTVLVGIRQVAKDRALIAAAKQEDASAIMRLLDEGADANAKDLPEDTRPFWRVCWDLLSHRHAQTEDKTPTVLLMILHPIFMGSPDGHVDQATDFSRNSQVVRCLLDHGANPNVVDKDGSTPLGEALCPYYEEAPLYVGEVPLLLIRRGAKLVETGDEGAYPLLPKVPSNYYDVSVLQAMLDKGADVNSRDNSGWTEALMYAVNRDDLREARFLIDHHAKVAVKDLQELSHVTYGAGHVPPAESREAKQIIRLLRQAGAG